MMETKVVLCILAALIGCGLTVQPTVRCPVPVSPLHGQVFLIRSGHAVKYVCDAGYKLLGTDQSQCKGDRWFPDPPVCVEEAKEEGDASDLTTESFPRQPVYSPTTPRPLFKWDDTDDTAEETTATANAEEKDLQNDEAYLHMVLYPERRFISTRVQRVESASDLEEEEAKRSRGEQKRVRAPSVVYVRRTGGRSPSREAAVLRSYNRAALHMMVDGSSDRNGVSVITVPAEEKPDKAQSDEALRYIYWLHHNGYPQQAALLQSGNGYPVVMTLSESQLAWINSLHPELRDKYLRDLYKMRAREVEEGARAQALLSSYPDAYHHWWYNRPYYTRQPLSVIVEDPVANYDYSCHQTDDRGVTTLIRAPLLPNGHIYRYDRRRNPNYPRNHYLAAEYRCNPGYTLLDPRFNELYCSKKGWVGTYPVCVPRG